jgi:hypothetical protein
MSEEPRSASFSDDENELADSISGDHDDEHQPYFAAGSNREYAIKLPAKANKIEEKNSKKVYREMGCKPGVASLLALFPDLLLNETVQKELYVSLSSSQTLSNPVPPPVCKDSRGRFVEGGEIEQHRKQYPQWSPETVRVIVQCCEAANVLIPEKLQKANVFKPERQDYYFIGPCEDEKQAFIQYYAILVSVYREMTNGGNFATEVEPILWKAEKVVAKLRSVHVDENNPYKISPWGSKMEPKRATKSPGKGSTLPKVLAKRVEFTRGEIGEPSVLSVIPEVVQKTVKQEFAYSLRMSGTLEQPIRPPFKEAKELAIYEARCAQARKQQLRWSAASLIVILQCIAGAGATVPPALKGTAPTGTTKSRKYRFTGPCYCSWEVFQLYYKTACKMYMEQFGHDFRAYVEAAMWKAHQRSHRQLREHKQTQKHNRNHRNIQAQSQQEESELMASMIGEEQPTPRNFSLVARNDLNKCEEQGADPNDKGIEGFSPQNV